MFNVRLMVDPLQMFHVYFHLNLAEKHITNVNGKKMGRGAQQKWMKMESMLGVRESGAIVVQVVPFHLIPQVRNKEK